MMTSREWQDIVYNTGYNDALHGHDKLESFNEQMRNGAMEEYYERGWTDGRLDRSGGYPASTKESLGQGKRSGTLRQEDN